MKPIVKFFLFISILIGFNGYSQQEELVFKSATEPEYGLNPQNPVAVYTPYKLETSRKMKYFLKGLRTKGGVKLVVVQILSIPNPRYKKPAIVLHNFITGEIISKGNGELIKKVILRAENSDKFFELYVNHYIKADLEVPKSFTFKAPENY